MHRRLGTGSVWSKGPHSVALVLIPDNLILDMLSETKLRQTTRNLASSNVARDMLKYYYLRNRWGSLTKNGVVNLNLNLMKAPEDVIDYVVLHELCHLKIKEHSHHYWDMLHKYMPNYNDKIEWLKANGNNLL